VGYDIHITRSRDWSDIPPDKQITGQEWLHYVAKDPQLKLAGYNGEYFAIWSGKSRHGEAWFDWSRGRVHTKNPDPAVLAKAIEIARALGARVIGDEGETYLPGGQIELDGVVQTGPNMDWRRW
jgi:hypothetical protein